MAADPSPPAAGAEEIAAAAEVGAAVASEDEPCLLADPDEVAGAFEASSATAGPVCPNTTIDGDSLCEYRFTGGVFRDVPGIGELIAGG